MILDHTGVEYTNHTHVYFCITYIECNDAMYALKQNPKIFLKQKKPTWFEFEINIEMEWPAEHPFVMD